MASTELSLHVKGLKSLQSSLRKASGEAGRDLKLGLKVLGKGVLADAKAGAPVGPRPRSSGAPPLLGSLRLSVTAKGVSVYSNAAHAYVQDRGGRIGNGAIIARASASGYMTKAVQSNQTKIAAGLERLLDDLERKIHT